MCAWLNVNVLFGAFAVVVIGNEIRLFRNPEYRKAFRRWVSFEDPLGFEVNLKYPSRFILFFGGAVAISAVLETCQR